MFMRMIVRTSRSVNVNLLCMFMRMIVRTSRPVNVHLLFMRVLMFMFVIMTVATIV
jgi:hypothetical protein